MWRDGSDDSWTSLTLTTRQPAQRATQPKPKLHGPTNPLHWPCHAGGLLFRWRQDGIDQSWSYVQCWIVTASVLVMSARITRSHVVCVDRGIVRRLFLSSQLPLLGLVFPALRYCIPRRNQTWTRRTSIGQAIVFRPFPMNKQVGGLPCPVLCNASCFTSSQAARHHVEEEMYE